MSEFISPLEIECVYQITPNLQLAYLKAGRVIVITRHPDTGEMLAYDISDKAEEVMMVAEAMAHLADHLSNPNVEGQHDPVEEEVDLTPDAKRPLGRLH